MLNFHKSPVPISNPQHDKDQEHLPLDVPIQPPSEQFVPQNSFSCFQEETHAHWLIKQHQKFSRMTKKLKIKKRSVAPDYN